MHINMVDFIFLNVHIVIIITIISVMNTQIVGTLKLYEAKLWYKNNWQILFDVLTMF